MRILQISDTHLGVTTEGQLKQMFRKAALETFDVIVHCGDYSGGSMGWRKVRDTVRIIRSFFPDKLFLSTIGNHDYWCHTNTREQDQRGRWVKTRPNLRTYVENLTKIAEVFSENRVHYLDKDGIVSHPDFPGIVFIGSSGWYNCGNPDTNDARWLPIGLEGDTHRSILKSTEADLWRNEAQMIEQKAGWDEVIFVSHFPVINTGDDRKGAFEKFSWSEGIGRHFQETHRCRYFLCGHAHQLHKGPLRYECGPDYYKPAYQIIEV